jgi:MFS transporter, FSR family, fosmidomycin resistance protein
MVAPASTLCSIDERLIGKMDCTVRADGSVAESLREDRHGASGQETADRRGLASLATGHAFVDATQAAIPSLLPFLVAARGFSYAAASTLVLATAVSSTLVQPLFGHYSDRSSVGYLMPGGVLAAGIGLACLGLVQSYALCIGSVVIAGTGVAAYHPEASRFANFASGSKRATGMSIFSVGGNIGFALGPLLILATVGLAGLRATPLLLIPCVAVVLLLTSELPRLLRLQLRQARTEARLGTDDDWASFARLTVVIAFRSFAYFGLLTFVPLYFVGELGTSRTLAGVALSLMLASGIVGSLIGGRLADSAGRRPVVIGAMLALPPLILAFEAAGTILAFALLIPVGMAVIATFPVTVVMGQEYLPSRIGFASGITLGVAIGVGGLFAPILGLIADAHGLSATMSVIAALPVAALVAALTLPRSVGAPQARHRTGPVVAGPRAEGG